MGMNDGIHFHDMGHSYTLIDPNTYAHENHVVLMNMEVLGDVEG